jgi:proteasome lid subunit RPN8/RPN11
MKKIIDDVFKHAEEVKPMECCGVVVKKDDGQIEYVRCRNVSEERNRFVLDPRDYVTASSIGEPIMIAHSHCYVQPDPSESDKVGCEETGLPWLIVNYPLKTYTITNPSGYEAPLVGRTFEKNTLDCYALVRDYYKRELNITLQDDVRPERWWEVGRSILVENFQKYGFVQIRADELKENDCLLMKVGASVPNHCAVYVGDNKILHHVQGRLSGYDNYSKFWRMATTHYLRYVS